MGDFFFTKTSTYSIRCMVKRIAYRFGRLFLGITLRKTVCKIKNTHDITKEATGKKFIWIFEKIKTTWPFHVEIAESLF